MHKLRERQLFNTTDRLIIRSIEPVARKALFEDYFNHSE